MNLIQKEYAMSYHLPEQSAAMVYGDRPIIHQRSMSVFPWPTGATKTFAVIGDPIDHSLSPALLNAAFTAAKLDAVFVALKVDREHLESAAYGIRSMGIAGLSVTMPHKEGVIGHLDRITDRARKLNSVNCIFWDDGELVGDSTDGPALVSSLESDLRESLAGKSVMILGTGGAARAIVLSLEEAGVSEIVVVGRREEAVARVVALGRPVAHAGTIHDAKNVDILINATSIGMAETDGEGRSPLPAELIESRHFVCDIVYYPLMTPLLADAQAAGARFSNGIGMLAHQAARAFWIWTGHEPPIDIMLHVVHSGGH
ncbi:MAG: shikimate dehydrogenase [Actinomycetota bacterium]|nr:MAG: shikimate dehydrogenase [Actinomycetota bacterium]